MKYKIDLLTQKEFNKYKNIILELKQKKKLREINFLITEDGPNTNYAQVLIDLTGTYTVFGATNSNPVVIVPIVRFKAPEDYETGDLMRLGIKQFEGLWIYLGDGIAIYNEGIMQTEAYWDLNRLYNSHSAIYKALKARWNDGEDLTPLDPSFDITQYCDDDYEERRKDDYYTNEEYSPASVSTTTRTYPYISNSGNTTGPPYSTTVNIDDAGIWTLSSAGSQSNKIAINNGSVSSCSNDWKKADSSDYDWCKQYLSSTNVWAPSESTSNTIMNDQLNAWLTSSIIDPKKIVFRNADKITINYYKN